MAIFSWDVAIYTVKTFWWWKGCGYRQLGCGYIQFGMWLYEKVIIVSAPCPCKIKKRIMTLSGPEWTQHGP